MSWSLITTFATLFVVFYLFAKDVDISNEESRNSVPMWLKILDTASVVLEMLMDTIVAY